MRKIVIQKLRRVSMLEFEIPAHCGVYLLTGANGAGKSTVLSCLAQLGDPAALSHFFRPNITFLDESGKPENILFESSVCYDAGDGENTVEYRCRENGWQPEPDPAAADRTFLAFGFPQVLFAGAKPKRQPVEGEIFDKSRIRPVADSIRRAAAGIFDDEDFEKLSIIRSPATGEDVYLRPLRTGGKEYYYSENNFSAGERSVIKLAASLEQIRPRSLVLIDEAEMALHPKAQKRLVTFLEHVAQMKILTVIVSTQSASLIKITDPKKILFLEEDEGAGKMVCRRNVYPAAILGEMAFAEEILPETMLFVEDAEANLLLEAIVERLKNIMTVDFPYTRIIPVGGFMQVILLMDYMSRVFPPYVHRRAVLDKDAEYNIRTTARDPNRSRHDVVSRNIQNIYFLPCAPEQGVVRLLERAPKQHTANLREIFSAGGINLLDVMRGNSIYREIGGDSRNDCKTKLEIIADYLSRITGEPVYLVKKRLYRYYVEKHYPDPEKLKQEYCPLIFRR